jgi:polyhydroxyalkanoate synthesis repressor PhaR
VANVDDERRLRREASGYDMQKSRHQIKKYSNRRLYDISQKRYITLDELKEMIRSGTEVEVLDSKTGEDLTQSVLIQIILESQKDEGKMFFTNDFLHMMIQYREMAQSESEEFFHKYLPNIFSAYVQWQSEAQNQFLQWARFGWSAMMPGFSSTPWGNPPPFQSGGNGHRDAEEEIERLKRKVAEMEQLLQEKG